MDDASHNGGNGGRQGLWERFKDQMATAPLIGKYYIPEETNNFWYALGGVLFIALALEVLTGILMSFKYVPDASLAYGIVSDMLHSRFWGVMVAFHYFNSFLIFGLVMAHIMRVFLSAAYRGKKKGLWMIGVMLAAVVFVSYVTGEALHWDELGFAVPWHLSEFFDAVGLSNALHYTPEALLTTSGATWMLSQIYAVHIALLPALLLLLIPMHFYLIRMKGISLPFWRKRTGVKVSFATHIRAWMVYGAFFMGAVLLLAIFVGRAPGTAPQLLPSSPYYQQEGDAGDFGYKPSMPIGWTNGWNMTFVQLGIDPDIWGTVIATVLMLGSLVLIPFVDREEKEPENGKSAFDLRKRGWAFLCMGLFWAVLVFGIVQNILAKAG